MSGLKSLFVFHALTVHCCELMQLPFYIELFYNLRRRHSMLGYASPRKFRGDWINTQNEQQFAAYNGLEGEKQREAQFNVLSK